MENKENKSLSGFWMATNGDGFSSYKVVVVVVVVEHTTRHDTSRRVAPTTVV